MCFCDIDCMNKCHTLAYSPHRYEAKYILDYVWEDGTERYPSEQIEVCELCLENIENDPYITIDYKKEIK